MRRVWRWLRDCGHDWQSTGDYLIVPGAMLRLQQCSKCNETLITIEETP